MAGDPDERRDAEPGRRGHRRSPAPARSGPGSRQHGPIVGAGLKMFLGHRETLDYLAGLRGHDELWRERAPVRPPHVHRARRAPRGSSRARASSTAPRTATGSRPGRSPARSRPGRSPSSGARCSRSGTRSGSAGSASRGRSPAGRPQPQSGRPRPARLRRRAAPDQRLRGPQARSRRSWPPRSRRRRAPPCSSPTSRAGRSARTTAAASDHVAAVVERIRGLLRRPAESAVLYGGSVSPRIGRRADAGADRRRLRRPRGHDRGTASSRSRGAPYAAWPRRLHGRRAAMRKLVNDPFAVVDEMVEGSRAGLPDARSR